MTSLLKSTAHKLAVAAGFRGRPPQKHITYTKLLAAVTPGIGFREVIEAETIWPSAHISTSATTSRYSEDSATHDYPAAFVATLRGAYVVSHNVLAPNKTLIGDLSVEGGIRPENVANHSLLSRPSVAPYRRLDGVSACLVNAYAANYYHWLLEVIPRYEILRRFAAADLARCTRILLNGATQSYHGEVLDHLGIRDKILHTQDGSYQLEEMIVPSLAGIMINPPRWACQFAREALATMSETVDKPAAPLLYLSRQEATRRRVKNEVEVLDLLHSLGFEAVYPERLTVAEQIHAFSHAKAVISPHGAALSNLIFCAAGTKVIEIFPTLEAPPCYWLIASHGNLDYRSIVSRSEEVTNAGEDPTQADFLINVDDLRKMLHSLELKD